MKPHPSESTSDILDLEEGSLTQQHHSGTSRQQPQQGSSAASGQAQQQQQQPYPHPQYKDHNCNPGHANNSSGSVVGVAAASGINSSHVSGVNTVSNSIETDGKLIGWPKMFRIPRYNGKIPWAKFSTGINLLLKKYIKIYR